MNQFKTGQIVEIRKRLWRIDSIYKNELTATSIDSINNFQKRFYIPLEDIKLADTKLPSFDKIGELSKQELLINAYRISLIHGSSPLLSLQRSTVIPVNFQLVPVIMALNSPRVRVLIADDVGLGKTIEAGLIINELIARQLVRRILIICPANLREQWQEALSTFFKLDFDIISSLHRKYLEKSLPIGLSPWEYFPKLITSVDYAKTKANKNEILNHDWDLILIDEAHLCARPHLSSNYSITMQRWELLKAIYPKTKHLLLLTATPHNGYTDSFSSLIKALDIQAVSDNNLNFINREKAKKHVCQRRRIDVEKWLAGEGESFNPFPKRDKKEVHIKSLSFREEKIYNKLDFYGREMMKLIDVKNVQHIAQFTILHFLKRALSSPYALKKSLINRTNKLKIISDEPEIKINDIRTLITEIDNLENITSEQAYLRIERTTINQQVSELEIKILSEIYDEVKKIKPSNDTKYTKLIKEIIPELFNYADKIIIFTRYKDTLDYLQNNLEKDIPNAKILGIFGEMKAGPRKDIFTKFEEAEKAILIATDCISEGMNLQYLCSQIIHYELPWNPNRLEQRNGRVDRFGQPEEEVHLRTIIIDGTLDETILAKIIERSDHIREEFGFSPPFFNNESDIIKYLVNVGKLPYTRDKKGEIRQGTSQLSIFDVNTERRELQQNSNAVNKEDVEEEILFNQQITKIKNESFYGQTDIRLPDIEKKLKQTENTFGKKEEIEKFIRSGLQLFGCSIQEKSDQVYRIILNDKRLILPGRSDKIDDVTFDKNYAARNPKVELIDLSHPLVNRLVQLLKQQIYLETSNHYGRIAYKISNSIDKPIAIFKVLVRCVVETEPTSIIEEILTLGFYVYNEEILTSQKVELFEKSEPLQGNRTTLEVKEDIQEVFNNKYWEKELTRMIDNYLKKIIKERSNLLETFDNTNLPDWLQGVTNVSYASHDILTLTMGYPV
ncbi:MAG: helicase-related protein [Caldisericota bacterium]|nr:helicase-related protein [Caldisericota bacterium]